MCKSQLLLLLCNYAVNLKREPGRRTESPPTLGKLPRLPLLTPGRMWLWVTEDEVLSSPRYFSADGATYPKALSWKKLAAGTQDGLLTCSRADTWPRALCQHSLSPQPNSGAHRQLRASARPEAIQERAEGEHGAGRRVCEPRVSLPHLWDWGPRPHLLPAVSPLAGKLGTLQYLRCGSSGDHLVQPRIFQRRMPAREGKGLAQEHPAGPWGYWE